MGGWMERRYHQLRLTKVMDVLHALGDFLGRAQQGALRGGEGQGSACICEATAAGSPVKPGLCCVASVLSMLWACA